MQMWRTEKVEWTYWCRMYYCAGLISCQKVKSAFDLVCSVSDDSLEDYSENNLERLLQDPPQKWVVRVLQDKLSSLSRTSTLFHLLMPLFTFCIEHLIATGVCLVQLTEALRYKKVGGLDSRWDQWSFRGLSWEMNTRNISDPRTFSLLKT